VGISDEVGRTVHEDNESHKDGISIIGKQAIEQARAWGISELASGRVRISELGIKKSLGIHAVLAGVQTGASTKESSSCNMSE
jgi:hypothetical protein